MNWYNDVISILCSSKLMKKKKCTKIVFDTKRVVIWQSKSNSGQYLHQLQSVWTWTTKILNRAGKSKTTGIPTSSGCKSPKDNWQTMWTIGPLLPGQATGAQNPNCPPLTYSTPKKSSTDPPKLAKVEHKHHFTPATASKSLPTGFIAVAHAMPCCPKWITIQ